MYCITNTSGQIIAKDFTSKPQALAYAKFHIKIKYKIVKQ
jgi:hypothetical protein